MTTIKNQWELHDRLRLTRDCELGKEGEVLFVLSVDGRYMVARSSTGLVHTGRDYAYVTKIGEGIPPGAYRLDSDVQNPLTDRRHARDWRKVPYWNKGAQFVVREQRRMGDRHLAEATAGLDATVVAALRARDRYTVIELAGGRHAGLYQVGPGDREQYAALAAALVPTEESLVQFMTRIGCSVGFAEWLVEKALVTREDLEKWWRRYQYGDDDAAVEPPAIITLPVHDEVSVEVPAELAADLQAAHRDRLAELGRELRSTPSVEGGVGADWGPRIRNDDDATLTGKGE